MARLSVFDARLFASLRRHRNYRLYFSGQLVSQIGTWLQNAAQAWLVLDLTHSATAVGVLSFFLYLPYATFGLIGGALADRWDRQRMMIVTQSAMAVMAAALAVVAYLHVDSIVVIDAIALVRGTIMAFNNPTRQAMMVQLVGRSELPNAIALNSSLNNATRVIGPAVAGVLIASVGVGTCFALNAISFVPVIIALAVMRPSEFFTQPNRRRTPLLISIRDGLVYARRNKTVAVVLSMLFVISTVSINFNVVLPVLARITLHGGAQTYGLITSMFGLGAFIGAVTAASRAHVSRRLLLWAAAGFGAAQLLVAIQGTLFGVCLALLATGVCYTLYTSSSNTIVQLAVPPHMQGRIAGLYNYVFLSSGPLGSLLAGWLADRGTLWAFFAGGAAALVMALVGFTLRPWPMPTGAIPRRHYRRHARNQILRVRPRG
ncbi:MAG TPA: MFS transporter [Candidatus Lustribacter sp.]|nr:MFS transporter [Candidatus Lustribacter sp.]